LGNEALRKSQLGWIEVRSMPINWVLKAGYVVTQIKNLSGRDDPHMIDPRALIYARLQLPGGDVVKVIVKELIFMVPAHSNEALVPVAKGVVNTNDQRGHLVLPEGMRDVIAVVSACAVTGIIRQRNIFQQILGDGTDAVRTDYI